MRWALILSLAAMTCLYLQAVMVAEWQRQETREAMRALRVCDSLRREAERLVLERQPPTVGWKKPDRRRPA